MRNVELGNRMSKTNAEIQPCRVMGLEIAKDEKTF